MLETSNKSYGSIFETIGHTPLIHLQHLYPMCGLEIYGKVEAANPGGSIKDRTAIKLISHAIEEGKLKSGQTVIESSSGNMAIGLAQTCLYYGLQLIIVVDPMINKHTLKILKAYGVKIDCVQEPAGHGSYLSARLHRVHELMQAIPNSFWPNQYNNRQNPAAHLNTMDEIVRALDGRLDYLFAATSTCGTLMGCAEYVKENNLNTKIIAVDALGSVIFGSPSSSRKIPGHGAGRPSSFLDRTMIHDVIHISDEECVIGCRKLLQTEAILCGGSSGAVVSAVGKYLPNLSNHTNCAIILCDRGERYLDTIYNDQWVDEQIFSKAQI